jgi:hypothetical protein
MLNQKWTELAGNKARPHKSVWGDYIFNNLLKMGWGVMQVNRMMHAAREFPPRPRHIRLSRRVGGLRPVASVC